MGSINQIGDDIAARIIPHYKDLAKWFSPFIEPYRRLSFLKKELAACLILILMYSTLDKVQQFFISFANTIKSNATEDSLEPIIVFVLNGLFLFWLSFVFWHKPKRWKGKLAELVCGDNNMKSVGRLEKDDPYFEFYSAPEGLWWLSFVASLPVLITSFALSVFLMSNATTFGKRPESDYSYCDFIHAKLWLSFLILVGVYFFIALTKRPNDRAEQGFKIEKHQFNKYAVYLTVSIVFLAVLLFNYANFGFIWNYALPKLAMLLLFSYLPAWYLMNFWYNMSKALLEGSTEAGKRKLKDTGLDNLNHWARRISTLACLAFFFISMFSAVTEVRWFTMLFFPISIILFVMIFYYTLWDFIDYNFTRKRKWLGIGILLMLACLLPRENHYHLKFNGTKTNAVTYDLRLSLEEYFLRWAKHRYEDIQHRSDSIIYLVSAEGGGSRSGAWTSSVLTELDKQTNGRFRKDCFAISSISGGSVGSATALSIWDNALKHDFEKNIYQPDTVPRGERNDAKCIREIFGRNYVSTAVFGLLIHDLLQGIPIVGYFYPDDLSRTDRHQNEESDAMRLGLSNFLGRDDDPDDLNDYYKKTPFLDLFYKRINFVQAEPLFNLPLFFPNTARVDDGRRGVLSPLSSKKWHSRKQGTLMVSAVDVLQVAGKEFPDKQLSFSEAVGLSQLFPYINSNVKIGEKTGTYMDGGIYENLGLTTLVEVFEGIDATMSNPDTSLLKQLFPNPDSLSLFNSYIKKLRCNVKLLIVHNERINPNATLKKGAYHLQAIDPLSTLLATPFSGHTQYAYWKTIKDIGGEKICDGSIGGASNAETQPRAIIVDFTLIESGYQDVVMSRWLSNSELDTVLFRSEFLVKQKLDCLK